MPSPRIVLHGRLTFEPGHALALDGLYLAQDLRPLRPDDPREPHPFVRITVEVLPDDDPT